MSNVSWRTSLGAGLLGTASICLLGATPLAGLLYLPPFPGGSILALTSGLVGLLAGSLFVLLDYWRQKKRAGWCSLRSVLDPNELSAMRQALLARFPGVISREELDTLPRWFLRVIFEHVQDGRESVAREMLAECSKEAPEHTRCVSCGLPDIPTQLRTCACCRQATHWYCCALVRRVYRHQGLLVVDSHFQLLCWLCLERLQTQGWHLSRNGKRWLLIHQQSLSDKG